MARIIVLDTGPLGIACGETGNERVRRITLWHIRARLNDVHVVIPEVADYEVRRELIQANLPRAVERLDKLHRELRYLPISTAAMRRAADLWADARRRGVRTADDKALDGDVIVAAQALEYAGLGDVLTVATDNVAHLSRYVDDARPWEDITPDVESDGA